MGLPDVVHGFETDNDRYPGITHCGLRKTEGELRKMRNDDLSFRNPQSPCRGRPCVINVGTFERLNVGTFNVPALIFWANTNREIAKGEWRKANNKLRKTEGELRK
jgi:hypothetical protein